MTPRPGWVRNVMFIQASGIGKALPVVLEKIILGNFPKKATKLAKGMLIGVGDDLPQVVVYLDTAAPIPQREEGREQICRRHRHGRTEQKGKFRKDEMDRHKEIDLARVKNGHKMVREHQYWCTLLGQSSRKLGHSCQISTNVERTSRLHWHSQTPHQTDITGGESYQFRLVPRWTESKQDKEGGYRQNYPHEICRQCNLMGMPDIVWYEEQRFARFCTNYRVLNASTVREVYPFLGMDKSFYSRQGVYFLNFRRQFWVLANRNEVLRQAKDTKFSSQQGLYRISRIPSGLKGAPSIL